MRTIKKEKKNHWNQGFGFIIATLGIIGNLCVILRLSGIECYVQRDGTANKEARMFIEQNDEEKVWRKIYNFREQNDSNGSVHTG